ncbi:MAG: transglycosylase SLT domain-containing protein [Cyanobacteriota bacterium]|nr:transglycosylase SLT domain-containing protein [Cyanobacteriota bacterium]
MVRLPTLLAISCLGPGLLVLAGRAALRAVAPALTPDTPSPHLEGVHRWAIDPGRRREAALLLDQRASATADPLLRRRWLEAQGWGPDPLAAVVLRRAAIVAAAQGQPAASLQLWHQLGRRFPGSPLAADALYHLGRDQPALRQRLRQRWPAHPAALAAALEAGPAPAERLAGALHLARWGARWPGADARLRQACRLVAPAPDPRQRGQLAAALASLGDPETALACLGGNGRLDANGQLALAEAQLKGGAEQAAAGQQRLLGLVQRQPTTAATSEALRLLSQVPGDGVLPLLRQLPPAARAHTAVQARLALAAGENGDERPALALLARRPRDPASRELQWDLARRQLLAGDWQRAQRLLAAIPAEQQPPALAARQRFWLGYGLSRQGRLGEARALWRRVVREHPSGYYGWRAAARLGDADLRLAPMTRPTAPPPAPWMPLASGEPLLDQLWRLDQREEAWELWRTRRGGQRAERAKDLLIEGRLRQGVGDDWTGLGQLEQASLRLPAGECVLLALLDRDLHPQRHGPLFTAVTRRERLPDGLLAAVARQESRFSSGVRSAAGAVGLLQLMPATASELAGRPLSVDDLEDPGRNAALGGRYLAQLLARWNRDPWLTVASYNAGPGAVEGWAKGDFGQDPERWAEAIPYPETRLYVKKVLGNLWTYQNPERRPRCPAAR